MYKMRFLVIIFLFFLFASLHSFAGTEPCNIVRSSEKLLLQNCAGVQVLTLQGTPEERAFLHGELLGNALDVSIFHYFSEKAFDPVAHSPAPLRYIYKKLYNLLTRYMHRSTPSALREELHAMARGMKVKPIEMDRAILLPDIGAIINRLSKFRFFQSLPDVGCTSVAQKNPNGEFTYGRNLDFASTGLWDAHPLITVQIPAPGSQELKHIAFGAPGVHFAGITGVNEAGITFSVHQNYSTDVSPGGIPMFLIGELVLRSAHSLDEAIEVLQKNRPSPLWTFVISDLKTQQIIAIETSMKNFSVRKMQENVFTQTNHIQSNAIRAWEYISTGTFNNSVYRFHLATKLAKSIRPQDNVPEKIATILAAQKSSNGEISAHQDILKAHTIQTVVFHKTKQKEEIFLSMDPAPTASGRYARFSLKDLWASKQATPFAITKLTPATPLIRKNQMAFAKSFTAYFDEHNDEKAFDLVRSQSSSGAQLLKAVLLYRQKKYADSIIAIQQAFSAQKKAEQEPLYHWQSLRYVKMLAHLGLKQAPEAKQVAQEMLAADIENRKLKVVVEKIIKGENISSSEKNIGFEFFSGDLSGHPY